jgi:hypothetical protein
MHVRQRTPVPPPPPTPHPPNSATATFNAFDTGRTGTVKLSFNQFLFASSHCI